MFGDSELPETLKTQKQACSQHGLTEREREREKERERDGERQEERERLFSYS